MNIKYLYTSIAIVGAVFLGILFFNKTPKSLGDYNGYPIFAPASSTGVLCGTGSTQIVATSTSRNFISISNISGYPIFVSFGTPAALNTGITIASSSTLRLDQNALYAGNINCIAQVAASTTVLEMK